MSFKLSPRVIVIGALVVALLAILAWIFISHEMATAIGGTGGGVLALLSQGTKKKRAGAKVAKKATASANVAGVEATEVLNNLGKKEWEAVGGKAADSNDAAVHKGGGGNTLGGNTPGGNTLLVALLACSFGVATNGCATINWNKAVHAVVIPPVPETVENPAIVQGHVLDCPRYVLAQDGTWHKSAWFASGPTLELDVAGTMLPGYDRFNLIPTPITTMDVEVNPGQLACTFLPVAPNVYSYFLKLHYAWGPRVAREQVWQEYAGAVTASYGALQSGAEQYVDGKVREQRTIGLITTGVVAAIVAVLGGKLGWDLRGLVNP